MVERFQSHDTEIRGHVAYWSVQSHVPNWFRDMEGKVPTDEMEEIALDWLDDLITRYDYKDRFIMTRVIHDGKRISPECHNQPFFKITLLVEMSLKMIMSASFGSFC